MGRHGRLGMEDLRATLDAEERESVGQAAVDSGTPVTREHIVDDPGAAKETHGGFGPQKVSTLSPREIDEIESRQHASDVPRLVAELRRDYQSERAARYTEFLYAYWSQKDSYHHHKEKMAHAAFLVEVALCAALLGLTQWPPDWIATSAIPYWAANLGLAVSWFVIHVFIRWQLRLRRNAALHVAATVRVLRDWAYELPCDIALDSSVDSSLVISGMEKWKGRLIDSVDRFVFPLKGARVSDDVGLSGLPAVLVKEFDEQYKIGYGALEAEAWLTGASMLVFIFMLARAFS